jgi:hypothetical protein
VLFDQGTPLPLRRSLAGHDVKTASEMGWGELSNGDLLAAARRFSTLVTTDQGLRYQQNLEGRALAILVLPTTSWPKLKPRTETIAQALGRLRPGDFVEFEL